VHRFRNNFRNDLSKGVGCFPRGKPLTLRGTIHVTPFGKGTDGVTLRATGKGVWILSYQAKGSLKALDGKRVKATGRLCDKKKSAINGKHLDLASLELVQ